MTNFQIAVGILASIFLVIVIVMARSWEKQRQEAAAEAAARVRELTSQFGPEAAQRILNHEYWQGMTKKMLLEAMGEPADQDENILRSKTKETWKYGQEGVNRFKLRVFLENDVVVGWKTH
jgi:hypothetical protein